MHIIMNKNLYLTGNKEWNFNIHPDYSVKMTEQINQHSISQDTMLINLELLFTVYENT